LLPGQIAYVADPTQSGKFDVIGGPINSNYAGNPAPGVSDPTPCGNSVLDAGEVCDWNINICCNSLCTGYLDVNSSCAQGAVQVTAHDRCTERVCTATGGAGGELTCQTYNYPNAIPSTNKKNEVLGKKCGLAKIKKKKTVRDTLQVRTAIFPIQGYQKQKSKKVVFCDGNGKCAKAFTKLGALITTVPANPIPA